MSNMKQSGETNEVKETPLWQNPRVRRIGIYAVMLLTVFLLGLIPMWLQARERDMAQAALRVSTLQNTLANAAIDARRGEYEPARQAASEFLTNLRREIECGRDSVFSQAQQDNLCALLAARDDSITLLARSDPASADRLVELYNIYRQATGEKAAAQ